MKPIHQFILPWDKSIYFLEYYAPCLGYLIDFLCIICYNDHFMRSKCIYVDWIKYLKKILSSHGFYALKLCSTSKNLLEKIGKYSFVDT